MQTYVVDFIDQTGGWYTYDVGALSLFDAAAAILSDEKGCRITAIAERINAPMSFHVVVKNHNDVVIYDGDSLITAAFEKRLYEYQTGNRCAVQTNGVIV